MTVAPKDDRLAKQWEEFRATGDMAVRNQLVTQYAPLVKYVAGRMRTRLPDNIDADDLISDGVIGLIDAIGRFEPERGLSFQTFAVPRIRGAIIDALRMLDILPRSVRAKQRQLQTAQVEFEHREGRTPDDEELAAEVGMSVRELHELNRKVSMGKQTTLEEVDVPDDLATAASSVVEAGETNEALLEVIRELPERDQIIIALYYFEGLTLAEIGRVLGVSEARISQVHSRATSRLRTKLVEREAG
jgi:RNA polymerase sigma factor for flagellar operon FliA